MGGGKKLTNIPIFLRGHPPVRDRRSAVSVNWVWRIEYSFFSNSKKRPAGRECQTKVCFQLRDRGAKGV
jgi:hypothetical protein